MKRKSMYNAGNAGEKCDGEKTGLYSILYKERKGAKQDEFPATEDREMFF